MKVHIVIKTTKDTIDFEIVNSSIKEGESLKGIGLENSGKRLEMLYPKKHKLEIEQQRNQFKVTLKIHDLNQVIEHAKIN